MIPFYDHAALDDASHALLARTFGAFTMLEQVLDWGRGQEPPLRVEDVVTQDEYTHDVLVPIPGGRYLVFDTT